MQSWRPPPAVTSSPQPSNRYPAETPGIARDNKEITAACLRGDERVERRDRHLTEGRVISAKVGGSCGVERQNILEPRH